MILDVIYYKDSALAEFAGMFGFKANESGWLSATDKDGWTLMRLLAKRSETDSSAISALSQLIPLCPKSVLDAVTEGSKPMGYTV